MISPMATAIILICTTIFLLVIIPLLDGSRRFGKYISLRYTLVAVFLAMALGCVLDFSHLMESSRNIVLMGVAILVGLFVIVRSLEKVKLGNKRVSVEAKKGDASISAEIENKEGGKKNGKAD